MKAFASFFFRSWQDSALAPLSYCGVNRIASQVYPRRPKNIEHYVLLAMISGKCSVRYGIDLTLSAGDIWLAPPTTALYRRAISSSGCEMLEFRASPIQAIPDSVFPLEWLELPVIVPHSRPKRLFELREQVEALSVDSSDSNRFQKQVALNPILQELLSEYLITGFSSDLLQRKLSGPEWYHNLLADLMTKYKNPNLDSAWMEKRTGQSRSTIAAAFREWGQTTPMQFLHQTRVTIAVKMLRGNPHIKIEEIARRCGYRDRVNFFRHFKKSMGMSPQVFRESIQGDVP